MFEVRGKTNNPRSFQLYSARKMCLLAWEQQRTVTGKCPFLRGSVRYELSPDHVWKSKHRHGTWIHVFTFLSLHTQVKVNSEVATGTGPNKKVAKRNAAEAMLLQLGYKASTVPQNPAEVGTRLLPLPLLPCLLLWLKTIPFLDTWYIYVAGRRWRDARLTC